VWFDAANGYTWGPRGVTNTRPQTQHGGFDIDFEATNLPVAAQQAVQRAINRWEQIITGDLPDAWIKKHGQLTAIDDLLLTIEIAQIDGDTLADANVNQPLRPETRLPIWSHIRIDEEHINDPQLETVLIHEIGHALGFGTIWGNLGLLDVSNANDPRFLGPNAAHVYGLMTGRSQRSVPVEGQGSTGDGSYGGHWREQTFETEIMTSGINANVANPLSLLTIAAMRDIGYTVNWGAHDSYTLPKNTFPLSFMESEVPPAGNRSTYAALWIAEATDERTPLRIDVTEPSLLPDPLRTKRFGALDTRYSNGLSPGPIRRVELAARGRGREVD
jgi:hypothetical protein